MSTSSAGASASVASCAACLAVSFTVVRYHTMPSNAASSGMPQRSHAPSSRGAARQSLPGEYVRLHGSSSGFASLRAFHQRVHTSPQRSIAPT